LTDLRALDIECNRCAAFFAVLARRVITTAQLDSKRLERSEAIQLLERLELSRRRNKEEVEMNYKVKSLAAMIVVCAIGLCSGMAAAQGYPTKPVRLIIPFPPGGSNDIVGRFIATKLTERLGKQVVADNRGGAGGVIGTEAAAKSEPDGYTLLIISSAYAINTSLYKLPYDPVKAFTPIAKLGTGPNVFAVHPGVPVNSVKDFIALAKEKPGQLNFAAAGVGSFQHLGSELFKSMTGVDVGIVQFQRGRPRDDRRDWRPYPCGTRLAHSVHAPYQVRQG
jgi:hypothetical protein